MTRRKKMVIGVAGGALVIAVAGGGVGLAAASGGGDSSVPITGPALEKAGAGALAHTHGGRVTDTGAGDQADGDQADGDTDADDGETADNGTATGG